MVNCKLFAYLHKNECMNKSGDFHQIVPLLFPWDLKKLKMISANSLEYSELFI